MVGQVHGEAQHGLAERMLEGIYAAEIDLSTDVEVPIHERQQDLSALAEHLYANIAAKIARIRSEGRQIEIYGPDWSRANVQTAAQAHADIIVDAYGTTYALPNKVPANNVREINEGLLDVYLMRVDEEWVGTACMVDNGDGSAELGRAASKGRVGNSIIQDLRIIEWLVKPELTERYHTLTTTLRTAPDRDIGEPELMRGGQAVVEHWRKFPGLRVHGFGPLYLKHGKLEQFACSALTRNRMVQSGTLYIESEAAATLATDWQAHYGQPVSDVKIDGAQAGMANFKINAHTPPLNSDIFGLVHADVELTIDSESHHSLTDTIEQLEQAGSPFIQVPISVEEDTRAVQALLREKGFVVFQFLPKTDVNPVTLVFGKVNGHPVVPTHWDDSHSPNPLWKEPLASAAKKIASSW